MRRSLTRQERIRRGPELRDLVSSARCVEADGLRMAWRANGTTTSRMAVVVGRGCGGAVRRNRQKRITREAWRSLKDRVPSGHDAVFVIRRFDASFARRLTLMGRLFDRAGFREGAGE